MATRATRIERDIAHSEAERSEAVNQAMMDADAIFGKIGPSATTYARRVEPLRLQILAARR